MDLSTTIPNASPPQAFPDESAGFWHVLHIRSRQEKILSNELAAMGVQHFLPLIRQVRYHGRRKARVEAPLFPGYLFLRGSLEEAYLADRTHRVAAIIRVADQRRIDWELRNIHLALRHEAPLDPYPFLKAGVRVEVRSGPLRGLQGVIENRMRNDRLLLQVNMLGRAVGLEVDGALLEVIE